MARKSSSHGRRRLQSQCLANSIWTRLASNWRGIIEQIGVALGRTLPLKFGEDALRLAEEFEQIRGRTELDNLIERLTPDE